VAINLKLNGFEKAQGIKVSLNKVAGLMNKIGIHSHFSIRHKKAKIPRRIIHCLSGNQLKSQWL
jgi:hypothetical protein